MLHFDSRLYLVWCVISIIIIMDSVVSSGHLYIIFWLLTSLHNYILLLKRFEIIILVHGTKRISCTVRWWQSALSAWIYSAQHAQAGWQLNCRTVESWYYEMSTAYHNTVYCLAFLLNVGLYSVHATLYHSVLGATKWPCIWYMVYIMSVLGPRKSPNEFILQLFPQVYK